MVQTAVSSYPLKRITVTSIQFLTGAKSSSRPNHRHQDSTITAFSSAIHRDATTAMFYRATITMLVVTTKNALAVTTPWSEAIASAIQEPFPQALMKTHLLPTDCDQDTEHD